MTENPALVTPRRLVGEGLGSLLVSVWYSMGGQWIPRRKLLETGVRVGNRVWLPFVRAHRYLSSRQSLLDYSLTQLYREAERHLASERGQTHGEPGPS